MSSEASSNRFKSFHVVCLLAGVVLFLIYTRTN